MKYPHTIREGGEEVVIYRSVDSRSKVSFKIAYYSGGKRHVVNRSNEATAHTDARRALVKILNQPVPFALSEGATVLRACQTVLAGLNVPPDVACHEFASAARRLGGVSLSDAVSAYLRNRPVKDDKNVDALVLRFVESITPPAVSWDYFKPLRRRLRRFARIFGQRKVNEIETGEIADWLKKLAVGNRTWNNERQAILTFFNWCADQKYLPAGVENEAAKLRVKKATTTIHIFTLDQVRMLLGALAATKSELLRYAFTGLFTGIRPTEMTRLEQEKAFRWKHSDIEVLEEQAKTRGRRLVPMEENWKAWMAPFDSFTGSFCPCDADEKLAAFAKTLGITWYPDIMRHSYISYMVAREQQIGTVALWGGNSEYIIKKKYLKMVTKAEGDAYFAILPDWPANVVHIAA